MTYLRSSHIDIFLPLERLSEQFQYGYRIRPMLACYSLGSLVLIVRCDCMRALRLHIGRKLMN